jgi:hypothetical protein
MDAIFRACVILKVASEDSARVGSTGGFQGAWLRREPTDASKAWLRVIQKFLLLVTVGVHSMAPASAGKKKREPPTGHNQ